MKSKCCSAPVKSVGGGDFNDDDEIGTWHFECEKCGLACDIQPLTFTERKLAEYKDDLRNVTDQSGVYFLRNLGQHEIQSIERFIDNILTQALNEHMEAILSALPDTEYNMMNEAYKTKFLNNLKSSGL